MIEEQEKQLEDYKKEINEQRKVEKLREQEKKLGKQKKNIENETGLHEPSKFSGLETKTFHYLILWSKFCDEKL